ncbi:class F sortase [Cellulosimicrobium arenosum]|uniref:Class F sortase n=1 Tax=Cellulosimicrobium arenosum TaxID=2708133 RepID=A0A927IZ38_9MICO|nr:class F sortase [Cellulosimicrobium arenosum]MBD8079056.1 class F sortase [Cellulosimicrobium arenosum]
MSGDARVRRGVVSAAVVLLLGGGTAVACGVAEQEPGPPAVQESAATPDSTPAPEPSATSSATESPEPTEEPAEEPEEEQPLPTAVRIPAIDVESDLITLGRADDGTIAVPEGPDADMAAWYDGSPRPGATGPSVIEGHVDTQNGPSVFHQLAAVAPGDEVEVDREDGSTVTFVVEDVQAFPKDEFPTLAVYRNTDDPELRLITCGGSIDPATGHYTDNTVVSARLADG